MYEKNSGAGCDSKFCPANTLTPYDNEFVHANPTKKYPKKIPKQLYYPPANTTEPPVMKLDSVDRSSLIHNRLMRQKLDEQRAKEEDSLRRPYQKIVVAGGIGQQEASKIKLILALEKLRDMGIEYELISQYFEKCFKSYQTNQSMDFTLIESFLVFDKNDLRDSATCYAMALSSIRKTKTTNYGVISDIIDGLADIVKTFM